MDVPTCPICRQSTTSADIRTSNQICRRISYCRQGCLSYPPRNIVDEKRLEKSRIYQEFWHLFRFWKIFSLFSCLSLRMGQAYSAFSILQGVASPRHKNFAETKGIFKGPIVTKITEKPEADGKKKAAKADDKSSSDLFGLGLSDIYGPRRVDHSTESKSWLGPSPKKSSDTKTAISPGPEKFTVPHDKDDMVAEDCSKYDTIAMMPATESQIFQLKEDKATSGKDTRLVTPKKSVNKKNV